MHPKPLQIPNPGSDLHQAQIPLPHDNKGGEPELNQITNQVNFIYDLPPDIQDWMDENNISEKKYTVAIKKRPLGGGGIGTTMPYAEKNKMPSTDFIGTHYGPGSYKICVSFTVPNPETGKHSRINKEHSLNLGEEWEDSYNDYWAEKYQEKERRNESVEQKTRMKNAYKGVNNAPKHADSLETIKNSLGVLKDLGVPIGGVKNDSGSDMQIFQMMQAANDTTMKMMMAMQGQMMGVVTALLSNNKPQDSNDMFKEILGMVHSTVDLKNALNPEKKGALDKIMEMLEVVLPSFLEIHKQKGMDALKRDPMVKMAKENSTIKGMTTVDLEYMINTMDEKHGEDDTDTVLSSLGFERTVDTQRKTQPSTVEPEVAETYEDVD
jgi:hypothetical protein